MKTFLKVSLGIVVGGLVLIVGCAALVSTGLDEQQKKNAITNSEYQSVKRGQSRAELEAMFGEPESADEFRDKIGNQTVGSDCAYWNLSQEEVGSFVQVCFDGDSVESKSRFTF